MPTIAQAAQGTVSAVWGHAVIRSADGKMRPLKVGDEVHRGDVILTTQDGIVQITPEVAAPKATAKTPAPSPAADADVDRAITELNEGDPRTAPAAGLTGGGDGALAEGFRVERISESLAPSEALRTAAGEQPSRPDNPGGTAPAPEEQRPTPETGLSAASSEIGATEEGAPTNLGLRPPSGALPGATVTVDAVPVIGEIHKADGSLVVAGSVLTPAELAGLVYVPPADYDGSAPVGQFAYTVTSGTQTASGGTTIVLTAVNDAPTATDAAATGNEDGVLPIVLGGKDVDGQVTGVTVTGIPAGGRLLLADGVTAVVVGQTLTPAQAGNLLFRPAPDFNGNTAITFTVIDNSGAVSGPGRVDLIVTAVNDPPVVTGETAAAVGTAPVVVDVLANDRDPDGDLLRVSGATVDPALGSVAINPDGTLRFSAAPGVTGTVTVTYTVSDPSGASATGTVTITVAPGPSLTVDAPALTNDSTPTITGTTNLPAGSAVTLTVTDALGAVQTVTATVVVGGTYSVDVPAALAEGTFTVVATASDAAGNAAIANDSGALDITAPSLTVDAPALTNDSTPTITGTTNLPAGSAVTLTITDSLGAVQTITATVVAGGTYSVDVPAALAEGTFTVVVTASDAAGNAATANDSGALDITAPTLTVDAPALTNDSTPTIAGTTNLPAGSTVTLTVTDALGAVQTVTAIVVAGGTYSVDVPAALAEGTFTVVATASDAAGNAATANDSGALDITAPTLTVDAPALTNDSTPTITGTTNLPAGSTVTLTVTDALGAVQTITTTVVAGGTYSVDVPAALAEGTFTVVATASDAAGNAATANDSGALDITAPTLTVDAPALTNDSTPTITGTTNLPAGSTVTLTVTDSLGTVQIITATVIAGGTYSVDVPAALAEGTFTVVATASDAAGNTATASDSGALDITAPSLTVDAPALTNDSTPTIIGTTNLPAGSTVTLTVTDALGAVQTITATVVAGGTYSVDVPAALAEGTFTVVATASDAAGNAATANDSGALDITAPSLTVDAPALTNDSTPTITGTTNLPAGSTVTLTVTDALGAVQTITATVVGGGTYSVDVPAALAEGTFTVVATASDAAGNSATANDSGALDITAPTLTVDAPALTNDSTPTITGTSNLPAGSTVTLTVTDALGAVQTITATVVAGGTYSVDVPAALAEGTFTVVATASDAAGNAASANDTGALDITPPVVTLTLDPVTADNILSVAEAGGNVLLTGRAGGDARAGDSVTLTIAGNNYVAIVGAGGLFGVSVPGAALAADADHRIEASVTTTDGAGNAATATATQGYAVNAAPAGADRTITTAEDTAHHFTAADFGYSDADGNPIAAVRIDTLPLAGELRLAGVAVGAGQVIAAADIANLSFVPAANANGAGYASFSFSVGDGLDFDATPNQISFDVTPVNDPAVIGGQASGAAVEDAPGNVVGALTVSDVDAGEAFFVVQSNLAGAHGRFSIDGAGHWTYTLDNTDPAVQALGAGQTLPNEIFTVTTLDGTAQQVTISITGTNDGPLAVNDAATAVEAGGVANGSPGTNPSGNVLTNDTDVDTADSKVVAAISGVSAGTIGGATAGAYGMLTLNADGSYAYVLNNSLAAVQALRSASDTLTDTFSYTMRDGAGVTSTATLTIAIQGSNDTPVAFADSGSLNENDTLSTTAATGVLANDTDVDAGDSKAVSAVSFGATAGSVGTALSGTYGTLTIHADGSYDYSASRPAADALVAGQVVTESFSYTLRDAAGATSTATLSFTITGTNDAPMIAGPSAGTVKEDTTLTTGGTLIVTDADTGQSSFVAQSGVAGTYGSFSITAAGVWTYTLNNAAANVQALGGTASVSDNFTIATADGTTRTIVVTVNGTNDGPVAVADAVTIAEDSVASGNVLGNDSDVDAGTTLAVTQFRVAGLAGTFGAGTTANIAGVGALTIAGNGAYTFTPLPDYAGPVPQATYTVSDGTASTTATLDVTINTVNDAPVNTAPAAVAVLEDVRTAITGLSVSDPDDAGSIAGQKLATVQLSVSNGTLLVTLAGGATISAGANNSATLTLSGSQAAINSTLASLGYQGNANYVGGDTLVVVSRDGLGLTDSDTVAIVVNSVNDAPVAVADTGSLNENATLTATAATGVLSNDTDVDAGDTKAVSAIAFGATAGTVGSALNGTYGTLTLNSDGSYSYSANRPAADALVAGQVVTEAFTYTVRDAAGATSTATLTFTITGANDAPTITGPLTGTAKEDTTLTSTGTLTIVDPDAGQSSFVAQSGTAGTYGSFAITTAGVWTYTLNNAAANVQSLGATSSVTDSFNVLSADGTTRTVVVTVSGTNDAPVAVAASFAVAEDAPVVTGSVSATDVDAGAVLSFALTGAAPAGLVFNSNGTYSFDPANAAYQSLRAGQSQVITVPYRVTDDQGATSTANLVITVNGTNDGPVAVADTGSLNENATLTTTAATGVLANDTDVDAGDTKAVSAIAFGATAGTVGSALNGTYGTLTLNADGSYSYSANRPAADALVAGQVVTEAFTYTMRDAAGATSIATLTFTITGANDAPTITGPLTGTVKEDTTLTSTGTLVVVDPDAGQSSFVAQSATAGTYGTFAISAGGAWAYTLNNAAANVQALGGTTSVVETFGVVTADGTTRNVVITVNGTNDVPNAVADLRTTNEDTAVSGNVLTNDSDIDGGTLTLTQFSIGGTTYAAGATATLAGVGTLTLFGSGAYTFTPAANYGGAVPVATYTVSDGSATSNSTLALSITPVADAPTLVVNGSSTTGGTTVIPGLPPSVGLQLQFYDNIAAVGTGNAGNTANVEAGVESTAATSTSTATDVSVAAIGVDDAYRFTGYIFLQGGQTYTIGGYRDDTLLVKVGGTSVYSVGFNNWGNLTGTAFTPAVSGYYSLEVIAYNGDGPGSLDLNLAVGSAAAIDLSTSNFHLYPDSSGFASTGTVVGGLVANGDGGYFPTSVVGNEDTAITLGTVAASLNDTDGSETLALRAGAIPVGATLSDGIHSFTATAGATSVDITGWALASLKLTPPANYAGNVALDFDATSTDSNGSTATSHATLAVQVQATADLPALAGQSTLIAIAQGSGTSSTLNLPVLATLNDTDGSEVLSVSISGVPTGATLNHGSSDGAGTWTLAHADLADLSLTLPAGYSSSGTTLTVTAISTESSNGATASTTSTLTLIADYTTSTTAGGSAGADTLTGNNSNNFIDALAGNDTIDARGGNDLVRAGDGNDSIVGGSGNDMLYGQAGNDTIVGGTGNDYLSGGAGNDTLTGSGTPGTSDLTTDVFAWTLADAGAAGVPATDTITDFSAAAVSAGGDVLDLRDLLSGDVMGAGNTAGNLVNFLDFSVSGSGAGASTTIHVSSTGQFAGGVYAPGQETQAIVLQGIDLPNALGLATGATDAQIIQELLTRGKLIVDSTP